MGKSAGRAIPSAAMAAASARYANSDSRKNHGGDGVELRRLPVNEKHQAVASGIQLASHTVQPRQLSEEIIPDVVELPSPERAVQLTLPELEQLAMQNNPTLAEARALVEAAEGNWLQVGLPPNTIMGYLGQQLGSGGQAEQNGLYVEQTFVRGGKLRLNREVAAQQLQKAEAIWAAQQQRVTTDVELGYYEVLIAQRRVQTTQRLIEIAEQAVMTSEALLKAKEVAKVDVTRARIELQTTQIQHSNAQHAHDAAWKRLAAVLGMPAYQPQPLADTLEEKFAEINADEAIQRIISQSPEMAAAYAEIERARWAIARAEAEPIPNVNVQAVAQGDNSTGSSNANLQVTMPIPWLNRNQGGIGQAYAELNAAELALGRVELNLQRRMAAVYLRYANAKMQIHQFTGPEGILTNAQATLDSIRTGYQAGEFAYLDLITAQKTYSQANLAYIEALGEFWMAVAEIEGLLLKGSLETAP